MKAIACGKLDEEIANLEKAIKSLESERFIDNLIQLNENGDDVKCSQDSVYIRSIDDLEGIIF